MITGSNLLRIWMLHNIKCALEGSITMLLFVELFVGKQNDIDLENICIKCTICVEWSRKSISTRHIFIMILFSLLHHIQNKSCILYEGICYSVEWLQYWSWLTKPLFKTLQRLYSKWLSHFPESSTPSSKLSFAVLSVFQKQSATILWYLRP